jgi:GT2 family glycosyltransferase
MSVETSIVIPVRDREALTRSCLERLLPDLPARCEVIVVDDASTDSTPALLSSYEDAIRVVSLEENCGFSRACNEGAALADGDVLVFLNNDTEPRPGWLDALLGYASRHPAADVVGAKLIYPDGTVQHAGVVFGQDGYPHNLYAGLPMGHPAVNRSRRLQAVTGACMLVRRNAFERMSGFDLGYENSLEDVDLCLRVGEEGGEVHYCHESLLVHLESASRGRRDRFARSVETYRRRWRDSVRRDDLSIYLEDGLLDLEYHASYPMRMSVSPMLAAIADDRESETERLLEAYARQVSDLMAEVMRLTAIAGGGGGTRGGDGAFISGPTDHRALLAEAGRLEEEARSLQERVADARGRREGDATAFTASDRLGYRRLVAGIREAVGKAVPEGSAVLVVSRGDRELMALDSLKASHFPQGADGGYLGHHPRDSDDAISRLEDLRAAGADYLVVPSTSYWWLDHYDAFANHLRDRYPVTEHGVCAIFRLRTRVEQLATEAV